MLPNHAPLVWRAFGHSKRCIPTNRSRPGFAPPEATSNHAGAAEGLRQTVMNFPALLEELRTISAQPSRANGESDTGTGSMCDHPSGFERLQRPTGWRLGLPFAFAAPSPRVSVHGLPPVPGEFPPRRRLGHAYLMVAGAGDSAETDAPLAACLRRPATILRLDP